MATDIHQPGPYMCEKCWSDAGLATFYRGGGKVDRYYKLLEERKDEPCYLDCPEKHPDHYSYKGCPACGYQWGEINE